MPAPIVVKINGDGTGFANALLWAKQKADKFAKAIPLSLGIESGFAKLAGKVSLYATLFKVIQDVFNWPDQIDDTRRLADNLRLSFEEASRLARAAGLVGIDMNRIPEMLKDAKTHAYDLGRLLNELKEQRPGIDEKDAAAISAIAKGGSIVIGSLRNALMKGAGAALRKIGLEYTAAPAIEIKAIRDAIKLLEDATPQKQEDLSHIRPGDTSPFRRFGDQSQYAEKEGKSLATRLTEAQQVGALVRFPARQLFLQERQVYLLQSIDKKVGKASIYDD